MNSSAAALVWKGEQMKSKYVWILLVVLALGAGYFLFVKKQDQSGSAVSEQPMDTTEGAPAVENSDEATGTEGETTE